MTVDADNVDLIVKPTTAQEVEMYQRTLRDPRLSVLRATAPQYFGSEALPSALGKMTHSIRLTNVVRTVQQRIHVAHATSTTSIMDIKLGRVRHGPNTPADRVTHIMEKDRGTTSEVGALRITGAVHQRTMPGQPHEIITWREGKLLGRTITMPQIHDVLRLFCSLEESPAGLSSLALSDEASRILTASGGFFPPNCDADVSRAYKRRLLDLLGQLDDAQVFEKYSFVSSSLLLCHAARFDITGRNWESCVDVKMIDFSQSGLVGDEAFPDTIVGFREGLLNLIATFDAITK